MKHIRIFLTGLKHVLKLGIPICGFVFGMAYLMIDYPRVFLVGLCVSIFCFICYSIGKAINETEGRED